MPLENATPVQAPEVNSEQPWLGLLPYSEAHREFFFGRDREVEDILGRIRDNSLTTLYGQSGWGKSSLLAAGVIPRLRESGYAPVIVRLNYTSGDNGDLNLIEQTHVALPASTIGEGETLWERLHQRDNLGSPVPVLLFDQFEEIFTLGSHPEVEGQVTVWLEQITDLLQNRPPRNLAERFAQNPQLAEQYHFGDAPVRIVFTLREDYLANLESWKASLPLLMQNRMALALLTGPQARQVVLGPAKLGEHSLVSREVAESIVRRVVGDAVPADTPLEKIKAVPPLLSLLCEQLNVARLASGSSQITAHMVGEQSSDILHRFYDDSFLNFPEEQRSAVRHFLEKALLTQTDPAYRNTMVREEAYRQLKEAGVPDPGSVFSKLLQRRLITTETRDNVQRMEITHDVLVPLLVHSRNERQERELKESAERLLQEEQEKVRNRRIRVFRLLVVGLALVLLSGALFVQAWRSKQKEKEYALLFKTFERDTIIKVTNNDEFSQRESANLENKYPDMVRGAEETPSILQDLGMTAIDRSLARKGAEVLAARGEFEDVFLLSLLQLVEGAHLVDEGNILEAIGYIEKSLDACNKAKMLAETDSDIKNVLLTATRIKSRLGDQYFKLNTVESLRKATDLWTQCIDEASEFDAKWGKDNQNRFHYYKTRISKALAALSKSDPSKLPLARKFLIEGTNHIRAHYAKSSNRGSYETATSLAGLLFDSAEIARLHLLDHQLAVELHTEVLKLRRGNGDESSLTEEARTAVINEYWYLAAAWLGLDKQSAEFFRVAKEGEDAAGWIVENSNDQDRRAEQQTNVGVFRWLQLQAKIEAGNLNGNPELLNKTIESYNLALTMRLENSISNDGLDWLFGNLNTLISAIWNHWDGMELSPESIRLLDDMLDGWRKLAIQERVKDPKNGALAEKACVAYDWSSVFYQKTNDGESTMKYAREAQLLFLDHAEVFKDEGSKLGSAWGLAGASSATRRMAEVLGGKPPGYQPKLLDGEDRLGFHEVSIRQAERAITEALSLNAMDDVRWMNGKLNDAVYSLVEALRSLSYSDTAIETAKLRESVSHKLIAKKYEEIFTNAPNGDNAFDWAFSGTSLLRDMWGNPVADLDSAEAFSREMLGKFNAELPKNTEDAKCLIGLSECMQCLAATIPYQVARETSNDIRLRRITEAMDILVEARKHSELALQIVTTKMPALEPFAKEELVWILNTLIKYSTENQLLEDQVPLWQSRLAELQ